MTSDERGEPSAVRRLGKTVGNENAFMCKSLFPAITEIEGDTAQMWVRYMTQIKPKPFLLVISFSELVMGSVEQQREDRKEKIKEKAQNQRRQRVLSPLPPR